MLSSRRFTGPPDSSDSFFDEFETFLHSVESTKGNKKLLILGDFNLPKIDWPNLSTCSLTGREFNFCETLKDFFFNFKWFYPPTRIKGETQSILDLVITNQPDNVLNLHIVNYLICSFRPIIHLYCSIIYFGPRVLLSSLHGTSLGP